MSNIDKCGEPLEINSRFLQRTVAPDDIYDFSTILMDMNFILSHAIQANCNLEAACRSDPLISRALTIIESLRLKSQNNDLRIMRLSKMNLNNK